MSVLIKGITIEQFYKDLNTVDDMDVGWDIMQLPPHGRLIDADAMIEANAELADCDFIHPRIEATLRDVVEDAPTIVEAEGED